MVKEKELLAYSELVLQVGNLLGDDGAVRGEGAARGDEHVLREIVNTTETC